MTEEEIAGIFDRVTQDLDDPWIGEVVRRAERDGGRIRRRHRVYAAAGSVLAVVALAAGGAAIATFPRSSPAPGATNPKRQDVGHVLHRGSPSPSAPVAQRTVSPSPTATAPSTPSPGASAGQAAAMIAELRTMLPASSTISDVRTPGKDWVEFDYNDGRGAVDFMFSIDPLSFYANPTLTCSSPPWSGVADEGPRPDGALPQSCAMLTPPGGGTERDWVEYADADGFYGYNITYNRPDGTVVWAQIGNGTNHTVPQVDRAVPPGSFAEWNALVQSPVWHL